MSNYNVKFPKHFLCFYFYKFPVEMTRYEIQYLKSAKSTAEALPWNDGRKELSHQELRTIPPSKQFLTAVCRSDCKLSDTKRGSEKSAFRIEKLLILGDFMRSRMTSFATNIYQKF